MIESQHSDLPIAALIRERMKALSLSRTELVRRAGYKNISKGVRRLDQLFEGEFGPTSGIIKSLPLALDVPADQFKQAVEDTKRFLREKAEVLRRAAFVPHAIVVTEKERPEPIFAAAMIGVDRLLRVNFEQATSPISFLEQALVGVGKKLAEWNAERLPCFGRPTGVIVNYSPDHAVQFDLEGNPLKVFDRAYAPGGTSLSIGGQTVTSAEWAAI